MYDNSISESLALFLKQNANPTTGINLDIEEDEFVKSLPQLCKYWYKEKIEIYIVIRNYFSSCISRMQPFKSGFLFHDFYDNFLKYLLDNAFEIALEKCEEKQSNSVRRCQMFLYNCFSSFCVDGLYAQINEITHIQKNLNKQIEECVDDVKIELKEQTDQFQNKLKEQTDQFQSEIDLQSQKHSESSMTVLGIFVGVVMVFFGGFSILENAINGMTSASSYRLTFTMLLFGEILYNVVILLFYLIGKLTKKTITCECYKFLDKNDAIEMATTDDDVKIRENINDEIQNDNNENIKQVTIKSCTRCYRREKLIGICRVSHVVPYIYWGNVVISTLIIFVFSMHVYHNMFTPNMGITFIQTCVSLIFACLFLGVCFFIGKTKGKKSIKNRLINDRILIKKDKT